MSDPTHYPVEVRPLPPEDGGGWLATFPDLPGCMGDGDTPATAIEDGYEAAAAWLKVAEEHGDPIPQPGADGDSSPVIARVPRSLHTRLMTRAAQEGVSMNALVASLLAEGMRVRAGNAGGQGPTPDHRSHRFT